MKSKNNHTGFGIRLVASIIDSIFILVIAYFISFLISYTPLTYGWNLGILVAIQFLGSALYEIYLTSRYGGPFGKLLMRCEVVNPEEKHLSFRRSLIRYLSKIVSTLLLGVGFLMILWDENKQGLHDKIAKTFVQASPKSKVKDSVKLFSLYGSILVALIYIFYVGSVGVLSFQISFSEANNKAEIQEFCSSKSFWLQNQCLDTMVQNNVLSLEEAQVLCSEIASDAVRGNCYGSVALDHKNFSICESAGSFRAVRLCQKSYDFHQAIRPLQKDFGNETNYLDSQFDEMFINFQNINNQFVTLANYDLNLVSQGDSASAMLTTINAEISTVESVIANLNSTVDGLGRERLSQNSQEQLKELQMIIQLYSNSLENLQQAAENYGVLIAYYQYEAQILSKLDKFFSYMDLVSGYVDDEKYDSALVQLRKAMALNDQMLDLRKEQAEKFGDRFELANRQLAEDLKYEEFITEHEKELIALQQNPFIATDEIFRKSDKLYEEYQSLFVEPNDASSLVGAWLDENINFYLHQSDEILTGADVKYNSFMEDFYLW